MKKKWIFLLLTLSTGVTQFLSFPNYEFSILPLLSFIPLFWVIHHVTTYRQVFLYSWIAGFVAILGGFHWLVYTMNVFGDIPLIFSILLMFIFSGVFALKFSAACVLVKLFDRRLHFPRWIIYPLIFATVDFLFPELFKWYWGAMLHANPWVVQIVEFTGMPGLTFLMVLVNAALFEWVLWFFHRKDAIPTLGLAVTGLIFLICLVYGVIRIGMIHHEEELAKEIEIALVQPSTIDIAQPSDSNETESDRLRNRAVKVGVEISEVEQFLTDTIPSRSGPRSSFWDWYATKPLYAWKISRALAHQALNAQPETQLLIFPESAFKFAYEGCDRDCSDYSTILHRTINNKIKQELNALSQSNNLFVYISDLKKCTTSACQKDPMQPVLYNNATLVSPPGIKHNGDDYQKVYLLPFGEYVPYPFSEWKNSVSFIKEWTKNIGNYVPGNDGSNIKTLKVVSRGKDDFAELFYFAPLICYESIQPMFTRQFFTQAVTKQEYVDFMVNTTNDSWFGSTQASYQHLLLASFRAIEHRRNFIRATNTGISACIDSTGSIIPSTGGDNGLLPTNEHGYLTHKVRCLQDTTFYTRVGDLFALIIASLITIGFILSFIPSIRKRRETIPF